MLSKTCASLLAPLMLLTMSCSSEQPWPGDTGVEPEFENRKRMFVTSEEFDGDLKAAGKGTSGLAGADNLCTKIAADAGFGGIWKAYLSGRASGVLVSASDRLSQTGPWYLVDRRAVVFANKSALSSAPRSTIVTEKGQASTVPGFVWTGTRASAYEPSCEAAAGADSWVSAASTGTIGQVVDETADGWITANNNDGRASCTQKSRLYCFEE